MNFDENYTLRYLKQEDIPEIIRLIEDHFDPYEIIDQRITSDPKRRISPQDIKDTREAVGKLLETGLKTCPCTVVVERHTLEIVAAIVTPIRQNPRFPGSPSVTPPLVQSRLRLLVDLDYCYKTVINEARLFERFPDARTAMELLYLVVRKDHRRQGLTRILIEETVEDAREFGVDFIYGCFTSPFSARGAARAGLKSVLDFELQSLREPDGSLFFADIERRDVLSVMVRVTK